jgi:spore germination protein KA
MNKNNSVSTSLETNLTYISDTFGSDKTVKIRRFSPQGSQTLKAGLVFIDGLASDLIINQNIIAPVVCFRGDDIPASGSELIKTVTENILFCDDIAYCSDMQQLIDAMLTGDTILFAEGSSEGIIIATKNWALRSVDEPDSERVISGPHEGFTESVIQNLSLIRRRITNTDLRYEFFQVGVKTKTVICMCFMEGLADEKILTELRKRINAINIDCIFDAEYIEEIIKDGRYSLFKTTGSTQRPDVVSAKLMEGRVALIINGSPAAVTVPFIFMEYFHSPDDYYSDAYYASFNRLLRFAGFIMTISLPAIYLALVTFHHEMLPVKMLLSAAQSRTGMPMSTLCEITVLILIFEMIREGSAKIPSSIGTAFSIVGGIVLGQASVDAHFVSLPIVIIVAFTGITGMIVPQLKGPVLFLRFILLFLADIAGLFGYILGMMYILFMICSLESFYIPYTSFTCRDLRQVFTDTFIRRPWPDMRKRPAVSNSDDVIRQSKRSRKNK